MRFLLILALALFSNTIFASSWEYRTAKSLGDLSNQPWNPYPKTGNPIAREYEGFIEYKSEIFIENGLHDTGLYLGLIGDADKTYLNGVQVGQSGNFPPQYSYNMDTERTYFLPEGLVKNGSNEIRVVVYSKFLVNKGFNPNTFKIAPISELDQTKYEDELINNLSKIVIPILCLVLTVVSFPLLAPKHLWNSQLMIFLIGLSSFVLGLCRGRIGYHFFDMLFVYKATLVSSVLTIWLVTIFMTKFCKSWLRFLPTLVSASLITSILSSNTLIEAASWGRIWFHISPIFLMTALYGSLKVSGLRTLRSLGLIILIATNFNDNLNDLRIISTISLLQYGLGIFIASMIIDQLLGLKRSWEKYFMKEAHLEIDAEVGKQAVLIAHDLRSPLEALKDGIDRIDNMPIDEQVNLNRSLARINEICNSLLKKDQNSPKMNSVLEINTYVKDVIHEVNQLKQNEATIEVKFAEDFDKDYFVLLDPAQFKRTLCNLVTNSLEATNSQGVIVVSIMKDASYLKVGIEDNGTGFEAHPETVFVRGFTTKTHGNGLGLSSAKDYLESIGGRISIENLSRGTRITIALPLEANIQKTEIHSSKTIVLIDDDPLVRFNWRRQALKFGITVNTFSSFNQFVKNKKSYKSEMPIFIDSNLGSERGEILSEKLASLGYKNIYLTTGLPNKSILTMKWIKEVVGKSFEAAVLPKIAYREE